MGGGDLRSNKGSSTNTQEGLVKNDTAVDVLWTLKSNTLTERETESEGEKKDS